MARLFSALLPAEPVVADLSAWLDGVRPELDIRWSSLDNWHVTLGFFGDGDDPVRRAKWLRRRLSGRSAQALRLGGLGVLSSAVVAKVLAGPELAKLAQAAGAGRLGYHPHLTVARWRGSRPDLSGLGDYAGPEWVAGEVVLFESTRGPTGPVYTALERFPLEPLL